MTLISTIISDAFREGNLTAVNTSPTSAEETEALRLLNRIISSMFGSEVGEDFVDVNLGKGNIDTSKPVPPFLDDYPDYTVPVNSRLILNLTAATEVTLPSSPMNGAQFAVSDASNNLATYNLTVNGNGRMVEGATSLVLSTNGLDRSWFYRGDLADWKRLSDLLTSDESPFPSKYDDLLVIALALRINPRNGISLDPQSMTRYSKLRSQFLSEYRQQRQEGVDPALLRLNANKNVWYWGNNDFTSGIPQWRRL